MFFKCIHILQKQPQRDTPGFSPAKMIGPSKHSKAPQTTQNKPQTTLFTFLH